MKHKRFGALSSSQDPEKLGMMVQAVILGLSGVIILVSAKFGIKLFPADIQVLAAQASQIAVVVAIAGTQIGVLFGLIRKFISWLAERKAPEIEGQA